MLLSAYNGLIRHLPYLEQAFETKKETWEGYRQDANFSKIFETTFKVDSKFIVSRGDLFHAVANQDFNPVIFSIIFWGYPKGYTRGNTMNVHFPKLLANLSVLKEILIHRREISFEDFETILKKLNRTGVGLSTLSKFFYFFNCRLEGNPCLILDRKIIDVLKSGNFSELTDLKNINDFNKNRKYGDYLSVMRTISEKNNYKADQLELFLFLFGKNLKPFKILV